MHQRISLILAVLLLGAATVTHGDMVWPDIADWNALAIDPSLYSDPHDTTPAVTDIRGDSIYAAAYWRFGSGGTAPDNTDHFMLRMRMDAQPVRPQHVWQWLLETDGDDAIDWVLQLDESGDNQVELVAATAGGPTFGDVVLSTSHAWMGDKAVYSDWRPTGDGSNFDGNADVFVSVAIPWVSFSNATGMVITDSFRVAVSTSSNHNNIIKDYPQALSSASPVADGWSDPQEVPEPATMVLFGLGALGMALRRRFCS